MTLALAVSLLANADWLTLKTHDIQIEKNIYILVHIQFLKRYTILSKQFGMTLHNPPTGWRQSFDLFPKHIWLHIATISQEDVSFDKNFALKITLVGCHLML